MSPTDKPTAKQLAYLRLLAARLGQSFVYRPHADPFSGDSLGHSCPMVGRA